MMKKENVKNVYYQPFMEVVELGEDLILTSDLTVKDQDKTGENEINWGDMN